MKELPKHESKPFNFSDLRQKEIYEQLRELVGPGPAAFFRDACWLMANPQNLCSTSHLVAHLLREIESAMRNVLRPVVEKLSDARNEERSHKNQIKQILSMLGFEEDSPEARAWLELGRQLHKMAHRSGLDAPRPLEEVTKFWESVQTLLAILLRAIRGHFLTWIQVLDELLKKKSPTDDDLKRLTQEVPNNLVTRHYFFTRLQSPEWIEPLWKRSFFKEPPQPEYDEEEGTVRFPPWPEARYLARMAAHKPRLVAKIISEMEDTDNAVVQADLVDAMLAMPPEVSAELVDKAERWAERPYWLLPEKLGQLIAHWAKGGRIEEALRLARALLDVLPDERRIGPGPKEVRESQARFEIWGYQEILKRHYPELVRAAGLPALELLCDLLDKAIRLQRREGEDSSEDLLFIWRPAIEDHPQNLDHTVEDAIVSALRDAAELVVRSGNGTVEEVVKVLEGRRWTVFRRIALHLLRIFGDEAKELVAARLTDRTVFEDVGVRHEYVLLLRQYFRRLKASDQNKVLSWIEAGPDLEGYKRNYEAGIGRAPSEEEIIYYKERWQRDWLARIGLENLPEEWQGRYQNLTEKHGNAEHPEFPAYMTEWIGPTSPKTADELKAMAVEEIVEFLRSWRPPETISHEPSPEGLGRVLSTVVAEDPEQFAAEATRFQGLDPTYVRSLLFGLREALKKRKTFDWEPVLDLCQWVLSQPREIAGRRIRDLEADPDWGWTRKAIADLLSAGLENCPGSIPIGFRWRVWDILKLLTEDPEPTPEYEKRYGGADMAAANLSINTTRGVAMHAAIQYALWVRRNLEKEPNAEEQLKKGFENMPEVREVLNAHLNTAKDPSLAVRAVYGWWFPWLVVLDEQWAREHAEHIFPLDEDQNAYFDAAWDTYITHCSPYEGAFRLLQKQYYHAVKRIGTREYHASWPAHPDGKLAEHLMVFYWRGTLSLEDPLLTDFWRKASGALREYAISFIGRVLTQTHEEIPQEIVERLKRLWEVRLEAAKRSPSRAEFAKELAAFGWWFASEKFDVSWALENLLESLYLVHKIEPTSIVLEHLGKTVQKYPLQSVRCLKMIAEGDQDGWEIHLGINHIRSILERALQDFASKAEAEMIINYLASRGFLELRELLKR